MSAVCGGDSGGDAFAGFDGFGESGAEAGGVVLRHGTEAEVICAIFGEGEADEAAAETSHEVDGFGGDELCGEGEIAFVFTVFVVDDYDHATVAEVGDCSFDVGEGGGFRWIERSFVWSVRGHSFEIHLERVWFKRLRRPVTGRRFILEWVNTV